MTVIERYGTRVHRELDTESCMILGNDLHKALDVTCVPRELETESSLMLGKHRLRATDGACVHRELETESSLMLVNPVLELQMRLVRTEN